MIHQPIRVAAIVALLLSGAALANPQQEVSSGVVVAAGGPTLVVDTPDGRRTFEITDETAVPAALDSGDAVLVRLAEPGSERAEQVIVIDDRVEVVAEGERERAVFGTVTATSPQQLLVETPSGGQAFVIDPEKLFPPLPGPDQRVAVTYRTLEVHPPLHMATGLVALPEDFPFTTADRVRVSSEPVQLAEAAPPPAPVPQRLEPAVAPPPPPPVPQRLEALPQTGTALPLAMAGGLLLVVLGVASRFSR